MYPKVLHRGPIEARECLRVENADQEARALDAGWSLVPASWGSPADQSLGAVTTTAPAVEPRKVPNKNAPKDAAKGGGQ